MIRSFFVTLRSGVRYDFERAEFYDGVFDIEADLAVPMSFIARYNGHTSVPWSDAAHACLVHDVIAAATQPADALALRFAGLHHDDEEVIVGDRTAPMKRWVKHLDARADRADDTFARVAEAAQGAIMSAIGAPAWYGIDRRLIASVVKRADQLAYVAESRRLRRDHVDVMDIPEGDVVMAVMLFDVIVAKSTGYGLAAARLFLDRHAAVMAAAVPR